MPAYTPQVDEPTSFVDGPPPAYTKGYSVRYQLLRLFLQTFILMTLIIGAAVLFYLYVQSVTIVCNCQDGISRMDSEAMHAEESSPVKLHIGENLMKMQDKQLLDCLVERQQQVLDATPPSGRAQLQLKDEQTIISCSSEPGPRVRRSPACQCHCAC